MKNYLVILFVSLSMVTFAFADCNMVGDINDDDATNVLDIIVLANYIMSGVTTYYICPLQDPFGWPNEPNILDIVTLANCILAENCDG
jgi:hypothetical protein